MKRIILIVALSLVAVCFASAQPKAVGGRTGYSGLQASYQQFLGSPNFLEINAGVSLTHDVGVQTSALYNFVFAQPNWTSRGHWSFYAGGGLTTGYVWDEHLVRFKDNSVDSLSGRGLMLAIPVQVGLSFKFWFPLQISLDVRPELGLHVITSQSGSHIASTLGFYRSGLLGFIPSLSVHYCF